MCGIVGYVGKQACTQVLLDTLSKLEYRGYDSAGIAVFENDQVKIVKAEGRLANLAARMETEGCPQGHVGIGHTRWATHGVPSDRNAHPQDSGRVTVVHNGIIENYRALKDFLKSKGRTFVSDTDTEVIAQLMDLYYTDDPESAIIQAAQQMQGSFALGVLFADCPDTVYAIRHESPLIVGIGQDETFIASDVTAILGYTREYILLESEEIARLTPEGVTFCDFHRQPLHKEIKIAEWDLAAAEKGGFPHFMIKEINEQPEAIRSTVKPRLHNGLPDLSECGLDAQQLQSYRQISIVACGTAMHAGIVGQAVIQGLARVPVKVEIASEFRYSRPLIGEGDLVIIISQSGETADSLAALRLAKKLGADTLAIVNAKGSSIAREANRLLYTHAGPEIAVASTKAYMVQLAVLYLFAFALALARGAMDEAVCRQMVENLQQIPSVLENELHNSDICQYTASRLVTAESLLYIGRGLDYALSMEGSLKLKEISYIHSESYAAGELKHGTISLISDSVPVIAVLTQPELKDKTVSNIKEVRSRGSFVVTVVSDALEIDPSISDIVIHVPAVNSWLMPMTAVVPLQMIAYYTAVLRGNDVDKPRNLAKSVTVE